MTPEDISIANDLLRKTGRGPNGSRRPLHDLGLRRLERPCPVCGGGWALEPHPDLRAACATCYTVEAPDWRAVAD